MWKPTMTHSSSQKFRSLFRFHHPEFNPFNFFIIKSDGSKWLPSFFLNLRRVWKKFGIRTLIFVMNGIVKEGLNRPNNTNKYKQGHLLHSVPFLISKYVPLLLFLNSNNLNKNFISNHLLFFTWSHTPTPPLQQCTPLMTTKHSPSLSLESFLSFTSIVTPI